MVMHALLDTSFPVPGPHARNFDCLYADAFRVSHQRSSWA